MQITKNKQAEATIRNMVAKALGNKEISSVEELSEGMLNIAYNVSFADGTGSIVKIATQNGQGLMSNEVGLMDAEVKAMRIMNQFDFVKVARVQYYDKSLELCNGTYFIMERLEGENYFFSKNEYTDEERAVINREIGVVHRKMKDVTGEKFGLLGDTRQFDSLYDFFYMLMQNLLKDVEQKNIVLGIEKEKVLSGLHSDKKIFEQVKTPSLVHWDMWEGNIFILDKHISGIIDWERAMWGEPYMDDRFRRHNRNKDFLEGFGKAEFTYEEQRRMNWYDLFLYGTMIAEVTYRQYEDASPFLWVRPLIGEIWAELFPVTSSL